VLHTGRRSTCHLQRWGAQSLLHEPSGPASCMDVGIEFGGNSCASHSKNKKKYITFWAPSPPSQLPLKIVAVYNEATCYTVGTGFACCRRYVTITGGHGDLLLKLLFCWVKSATCLPSSWAALGPRGHCHHWHKGASLWRSMGSLLFLTWLAAVPEQQQTHKPQSLRTNTR